MAQFRLPANSRYDDRPGHHHPAPAGATRARPFRIYRWDPDSSSQPRVDTYDVDSGAVADAILSKLRLVRRARLALASEAGRTPTASERPRAVH